MLMRPEDRWAAPIARNAAAPVGDFRFETFFDGAVGGWGVFQDRFGTVRKRFTVDMHGGWRGDAFLLEEHFVYSDGGTDDRTWRVTMPGPGRYRAEAHDIVGVAEGRAHPAGVNFRYALRVPVGEREFVFDFDDWMAPHDTGLLNISCARKLGIKVGQLTGFFWRKDGPATSR